MVVQVVVGVDVMADYSISPASEGDHMIDVNVEVRSLHSNYFSVIALENGVMGFLFTKMIVKVASHFVSLIIED